MADDIGIPLSNLLNAYLSELAATGSVHFTTAEPMTNKMEVLIKEAEADIIAGRVSPVFTTVEELFAHLDTI